MNNIPLTSDIHRQIHIPLVMFIQPLAIPHIHEEHIQVFCFSNDIMKLIYDGKMNLFFLDN